MCAHVYDFIGARIKLNDDNGAFNEATNFNEYFQNGAGPSLMCR